MTPDYARQLMIYRLLHMDDGEDNNTEEGSEETNPAPAKKQRGSSNLRLPFGLCARYNIALPYGATPRDAWDALKEEAGITAKAAYQELQRSGHASTIKPTKEIQKGKKQGSSAAPKKFKQVSSPKDFPSGAPCNPYAKYSICCVINTEKDVNVREMQGDDNQTLGRQYDDEVLDLQSHGKKKEAADFLTKKLADLPPGTMVEALFGKHMLVSFIKTGANTWKRYKTSSEINPWPDFEDAVTPTYQEAMGIEDGLKIFTSNNIDDALLANTYCDNAVQVNLIRRFKIMEPIEDVDDDHKLVVYNPAKDTESVRAKLNDTWSNGQTSCIQHPTPHTSSMEETTKFLADKIGCSCNFDSATGVTNDAVRQASDAIISVKERYGLKSPQYITSEHGKKNSDLAYLSFMCSPWKGYSETGHLVFRRFVPDDLHNEDWFPGYKEIYDSLTSQIKELTEKQKKAKKAKDGSFTAEDKKQLKDLQKELNAYKDAAFCTRTNVYKPGQEALSIALHEMGHAVSLELLSDGRDEDYIKAVRKYAYDRGDIYKISQYATHIRKNQPKPFDEFFAECFAAYHLNEPLPQYIKDMIEYAEWKADVRKKKQGKKSA